jgi:hypothetical protein
MPMVQNVVCSLVIHGVTTHRRRSCDYYKCCRGKCLLLDLDIFGIVRLDILVQSNAQLGSGFRANLRNATRSSPNSVNRPSMENVAGGEGIVPCCRRMRLAEVKDISHTPDERFGRFQRRPLSAAGSWRCHRASSRGGAGSCMYERRGGRSRGRRQGTLSRRWSGSTNILVRHYNRCDG